MSEPILKVRDLTRVFGGIRAVDRLSFDVGRGGVTGLIGPNGAGKTTVFNLITAVYKPTSGSICLGGTDLVGRRPDEVVRSGVSRTFQNIRLFSRMTCLENVMTPILARASSGPVASLFGTPSARREKSEAMERAYAIMKDIGIEDSAHRTASTLPYGLQRKLEIARAIACSPSLLLLDEPAAGMNDSETRELGETIVRIRRDFDVAILLIEHHIHLVMSICAHIVVMERGALLASGSPGEIREDSRVVDAYLGRHRDRRNAK